MKIGIDAQVAIRSFAQSLIAGDFGPDDSRDGRSQFFLKEPSVVGQAMAIFLYRLELDSAGRVLNPDEAEELYEPANDKIYRHPTFYDLPDEVGHM